MPGWQNCLALRIVVGHDRQARVGRGYVARTAQISRNRSMEQTPNLKGLCSQVLLEEQHVMALFKSRDDLKEPIELISFGWLLEQALELATRFLLSS